MNSPAPEYDIIFAGGGTAACVAAGRLASADPSLRILIVENGPSTKDNVTHVQPGRWVANLTNPRSETFTRHSADSSAKLNGRAPGATNAKCVGGAGSVNGMMYNRAPASDYDDWMRLGNPGWGSADLIPLAKKLETYQAGVVDFTHGTSGPIKVSYGGYETKTAVDFLSAAAAFPRGRSFTEDMNDFHTCDVYGRLPRYIDAETGRRSDTAHHYVYSQAHNPNLHIMDHARVNRVLFDAENRAVGIEYQTGGASSAMLAVHALRLVVVSAGAYCSPAILERSGIGAREILEQHGISVVCDLPGVGQNYKDHPSGAPTYLASEDVVTLSALAEDADGVFEAQWQRDGKGLLATNALEAGIKLRPNEKDLEQLTAAFAGHWKSFFADAIDKPTVCIFSFAGHFFARPGAYGVAYFMTYPLATGSAHITSKDPFSPLAIDVALLNHDEDLLVLRWSYKWSRELARRMDSFRGECAAGHPKFAEDSQAKCGEANGPVEFSAPEIQYSAADDEAIDEFHRATGQSFKFGGPRIQTDDNIGAVETVWHALGTCAMRPREEFGVVDARLNVYGVTNLKVVDMSIAPLNVGANTYHTAILIGEKAAMLIGQELGISGV
ncbi:GMC oxidoreductase-domain-containing protein [Mycena metata]|uniref:GMC oxidoreductase-domain-containing protein n=1 Tax=Mycena metata TaxID=1033252 RepID=A0AAD7HLQ2_9AGAR|nr:GMC oxidoreductase-domain-containing protein [Mycena metata]KAJ7722809.1 GMC oxidoreductase-domain-containing protein [Mycena metata]